MEAKKLRELMKKEKEKRAASTPSASGAQSQLGARHGAAAVVPAARERPGGTAAPKAPRGAAAPAVPVPAAVVPRPAAPTAPAVPAAGVGLLGAYGEGSDEEAAAQQAPEAKRQRTAADVAAMPPPALAASRAAADAAAMPPPSLPGRDAAEMPPPAGLPFRRKAEAGDVAVSAPAKLLDAGEVAEPVEEQPPESSLPEGFFDDPEADARARGVEAPSVRKQRELEEGLKRFEKEMQVETEKTEEIRNELDEEKFEEVMAEEEDFQSDLHGRIEALRKEKAEKLKAAAEAVSNAAAMKNVDSAALEVADEDEDSGSDVEFDWRAKGFS